MNELNLEDIERSLGHDVDPTRMGTIHDLYDLPADLLEDTKKLRSMILRYRFLQYYTSSSLWPLLSGFIDDVFDRGVELRAWRRGGILFPLFSVETLVTLDVARILSVLGPTEDEHWFQVVPQREAWDIKESVIGAPAVNRPQLRYDFECSNHVRRMMTNDFENLLEVDDVLIATRRWIASRIAVQASKFGGIERFADPAVLLEIAFQTVQRPSNDALIAARGILHEIRVLGPSKEDVPGFRGPLDWYR